MVQLTVEQRVSVVQKKISTHSYVEVRRRFQIQFPGRRPPTDMTMLTNTSNMVRVLIVILRIQVEKDISMGDGILNGF